MTPTVRRILTRIRKSGLNQSELAAGSGIAQSTISRIIAMEVTPGAATADAIEKFLDQHESQFKRRLRIVEAESNGTSGR
ncbi:MAG: helix-turn-helix transcriptional regulator [Alphaproteobacteria bacterium]|nr:helix-turn-helix transcriptional regulator [Alphaproteobacteria bacterium]